jgi:hypothetical protein
MFCLIVVAALIAVYGLLAVPGKVAPQPKPLNVSSVVHCSFPDKSFCSIEQSIKRFVASKDSSDILENQLPINTSCSGAAKSKLYCKGSSKGTVIQLFQVQHSKSAQLLSRNNYITFFNSYFRQYGPFSFAGEAAVKSDIVMRYVNQAGTEHYTLTFIKIGSFWKLEYPTVD